MEVDVAVLTMLDGELELFEQTLQGPDAVRYFWSNAAARHGVFFSAEELCLILCHIGTSPSWDFVTIRRDTDSGTWAQACGCVTDGLAVEVNGPSLVVRRGAARRPRVNIGTTTWRYLASREELHDVETAARVMLEWVNDCVIDDAFEERDPDGGVPRSY